MDNVSNNEKEYVVYCHTNLINNKKYIGITKQNPLYRWRSDGSGYFRSPYFYNAIQKYGWDNFEHEIIISDINREQALQLEKYYISLYNTNNKEFGYNMTLGGDGSCGYKPTKETIEKIASKNRGKKRTEETKQKLSNSLKGKRLTEETKKKLSENHKGYKLTPKQKEIALQNLKYEGKSIYGVNETDNSVLFFSSISEASNYFNSKYLSKSFKLIVEKQRVVCGYKWYYKEG